MEVGIIVPAMLGSAGLFGLVQFLILRHDRRIDDLQQIQIELESIKNSQMDTKIRVTRMELLGLMRNDPDNIDAILQVAEDYFIEFDGNAYVHAIFEKWAKQHDVAIGWLPTITKGVKHGNKRKKR